MEKNNTLTARPANKKLNRIVYVVFVLTGLGFTLFKHDFSNAVIFWGLALAFDPFNQSVPFYKRPVWQQALLFVHLVAVLTLFVLLILRY